MAITTRTRRHKGPRRARTSITTTTARITALETRLADTERRLAALEAAQPNRLGLWKDITPAPRWPDPNTIPCAPEPHPDVVPVTPTVPGTWPGNYPIVTCKAETPGEAVS